MELVPAISHGTLSQGCVIKGWRNTPKGQDITLGSKIISIDGEYVEYLSFSETVERMRNSTQRVVLLESPGKLLVSKENISPNSSFRHSTCGSIETTPKKNLSNKKSSPLARAQRQSACKSPAETPNTTINRLRLEGQEKDGLVAKLHNQHAMTQQELSNTRNEVTRLQSEVASWEQEVLTVKGSKRDTDGQILLLKYQLDRIRRQCSVQPSGQGQERAEREAEEKAAWLSHWAKFRAVLQTLPTKDTSSPSRDTGGGQGGGKGRGVDSSQQCELSSPSEGQGQYELLVQQRLSNRLEMQLRCWVDGQIELHKKLAAEEGLMDFQQLQKVSRQRALSWERQQGQMGEECSPRIPSSDHSVQLSQQQQASVGSVDHSNRRTGLHWTPRQAGTSPPATTEQQPKQREWHHVCAGGTEDLRKRPPSVHPEQVPKHKTPPQGGSSPVLSPQMYRSIQSALPESCNHSTREHAHGLQHTRSTPLERSLHQGTASRMDTRLGVSAAMAPEVTVATRSRSLKSTALREQMRRLKEESASIRGDLMKFRSTIRVRMACWNVYDK